MRRLPKQTRLYFLLGGILLLAGCSSPLTSYKEYHYQEVFYLTTRQDTGSENPGRRYSGERGDPTYGVSMVAIDPEKTFGRFAEAGPNQLLQQSDLLESQPLQQLAELEEAAFLQGLSSYPETEDKTPEILVYIHGYKKSFARANTIAAQLRYELAFPGPVIAFSWPSKNSVSGYVADMENLNWSERELRHLIDLLANRFPDAPIHIIAHSLGNRALVETLFYLKKRYPPTDSWPIGEIVFIAPDYDRSIFIRDIATELKDIPSRKTLYVSAKDFPLFASATVYQYPRLGDSRDGVPVIDGIETVDVSDAVPIFDGHGYYEANGETIEDLYHLIHEGLGATERPTLQEHTTEEGTYWRLQPSS